MRDLHNPTAMWIKAGLFLAIAVGSAVLLLLELGSLRGALLLALTVWGFCRAYYFAFYVLEKYIDPSYRFSGLISVVRYLIRRRG